MNLQRIDLQAVETRGRARGRRALTRFPTVSGAYLFGSCFGAFRPDSDIDLGLVLAMDPVSPLTNTTDVEVGGRLGNLDGPPFHVMTLTDDTVEFSFGVVSRGRMVYEANPTTSATSCLG